MSFTDLIGGLAFVDNLVGLSHLDEGLRDSISIPAEQLQAHHQLISRDSQIKTIAKQLQQFGRQANSLNRRKQSTQHAQLTAQMGQLQLQSQQLQAERQALELELQRERRAAQDNRILKAITALYDQAQTSKQQERLLDYVVVVIAALRVCRQIHSDLDNANDRMMVSELKEKLLSGLRDILASSQNRSELTSKYADVLGVPIALIAKGKDVNSAAAEAIRSVETLRLPPDDRDWQKSLLLSDSYLARLSDARTALIAVREEFERFSQGLDTYEFFFPARGEDIISLVVGIEDFWQEWIESTEARIGTSVIQIHNSQQEQLKLLNRHEEEIAAATETIGQLRTAHEIGRAAAFLQTVIPPLQKRFDDLNNTASSYLVANNETNVTRLIDAYIAIRQIKAALLSDFAPFRQYVEVNDSLNSSNYVSAAAKRLADLNEVEGATLNNHVTSALGLREDISALERQLEKTARVCKRLLYKAVGTDTSFEKLRAHVSEITDTTTVQEVEAQAASQELNPLDRILAVVQGKTGKEVARRRRLVDQLADRQLRTASRPEGDLPDFENAPAFPTLPEVKSRGPKLRKREIPAKRKLLAGAAIGLSLCSCIGFFAISGMVQSRAAAQATETAYTIISATEAAQATEAAWPTDTPVPTNTPLPTSTSTLTSTPLPTSTRTPTIPPATLTAAAQETADARATLDRVASQTAVAANATATQAQFIINVTATAQSVGATRTQEAQYVLATASAQTATATYLAQFVDIDYRELRDYADQHIGEKVCVRGRVFNIIGIDTLQLWFAGTLDAVYVEFERPFSGIYEDSSIRACGTVYGFITGQNAFGGTIRQPAIYNAFLR